MGELIPHSKRVTTIKQMFESKGPTLLKHLPKHLDIEHFIAVFVTELGGNPKLAQCSEISLVSCLFHTCQMGLRVGHLRGEAFLVPRAGVCTLNIGYKGLEKLAMQSGRVKAIRPRSVWKGDKITVIEGTHPEIVHYRAKDGERTNSENIIGVYATAEVEGCEDLQFEYMDRDEVDRIRVLSPAGKKQDTPWDLHYEEMAKKTAVRRLCKHLPMETDSHMGKAVALDEAAEEGRHGDQVAVELAGMFEDDLKVIVDDVPPPPAHHVAPAPEATKRRQRKKPTKLDDVVPPGEDPPPAAEPPPAEEPPPAPTGTELLKNEPPGTEHKAIVNAYWQLTEQQRMAIKAEHGMEIIGEASHWPAERQNNLLVSINDLLQPSAG